MEWRKVKTILILMLLLVNGFLLVLVGARRGEMRRYEQTALDQAIQVLEANGIRVAPEGLTSGDGLPVRRLERNIQAEEALARALLDEKVSGSNLGGGLYVYSGNRGQVSFRAGGELVSAMPKNNYWYGAEPRAFAEQLLIFMDVDGEVTDMDLADGSGTVTVCQWWEGVPLFSCELVFTFEDHYLVSLSGSLLLTEEAEEEEIQCLTLPTALLRFLDEIRASGDVCSQVESMKPGYRMTQSYSGTVTLTPVWHISTNTADYYMDAGTGALTRISE